MPPATTFSNPLAFASCSIGLPRHTLHQKIEAIRAAGFKGIELSFPDLLSFAKRHFFRDDITEDDYDTLCEAGEAVQELCKSHELEIIVLQPFPNFEGWPRGSKEREAAFTKAKGWIRIMRSVGTDMLQVGSTDSDPESISSSFDDLAGDLAELADLLSPHGFRLAYENWCWATRTPTWKACWELVKKANRPNIGLCLDTFQTAGGEWGDPTTQSGLLGIDVTPENLSTKYRTSLEELTATVPKNSIYFLQVSDAYRMTPPIADGEKGGLRPRGRWSHDYRPLPFDGGYLPIAGFLHAVLATGFRGWVSIEVFDGKFEEKYGNDLNKFAKKAMEGYAQLLKKN